jgi:hypothetical protein
MKALDLKHFKKQKEDAQSATMIHKDGHMLVISKGSLPHAQRKALEAIPMMAQGGKVKYAEGTDDVEAVASSDPDQPLAPDVEAITPSDSQQPNPQAPPQTDQAPQQQAQSNAPMQGPPQNPLQAQYPGFAQEQQANLMAANALQQQGQEETEAYKQAAQEIKSLPTQARLVAANKAASDELFKKYKSKELDPDHYWQNHSKIAAGVGILLSGVGQAMGAKSNGALDAINTGIERDIDAQKTNQQHGMNLWRMNREALGNDLAANLATQNQYYVGLKYKLDQAAANAKGPLALQNAQIANAKINQAIDANNFKLALMNPSSDNPDPASRIQFLVPPEAQARVAGEIDAATNTVANAPGILEAFHQAAQEVRPLSGGVHTSPTAFVPGIKSPGQAALQARLGPTFKDVEGTVRQAAMDNLDHNVTPKFGDDDSTIATKRQSLIEYMKSKSAAANAKSFGIDLTKYPKTNTQSIGQYKRQVINGKAYMVPVR